MTAISIDELPIPASADDPAFADYARFVDVGNANREFIFGTSKLNLVARNLIAVLQDQTYYQQRPFAAWLDGEIVGSAVLVHMGQEPTPVAWLGSSVHPNVRNRGVGTALVDHIERLAGEAGYTTFQVQAAHTSTSGEPRLASPTGFGDLPRNDPGVRFLLKRGYRLQQINRISFLHLPIDSAVLVERRAEAEAKAGPDYRVLAWTDPTPERWVDDIALLNSRMFTDAPLADMDMDTTPWDAARVRAEEQTVANTGRIRLTAAVEHRPSGHLVAFNELFIPQDRARPVTQGATLVLKGHRGHRLGMLVKIANIQELAQASPESRVIETDNAEENRPMLDVNEAIGFRAIGYSGMWKKTLI
jgi:GNAT superfamily N-acetyltransferase